MSLQEQANLAAGNEEAALAELAEKIMIAAIEERASDIHLEPDRESAKVRYRVDGVMTDVMELPRKNVYYPLVNRLMRLGEMDEENRVTIQHGRIHLEHEGRDYDLRETMIPVVYGPMLAMRILDQSAVLVDLDRIGLQPADRQRLEACVRYPQGLVIFSGPTGSGKTTTMYGCLKQLIKPENVIYTIEDPVEVRIPGTMQIHINRKHGLLYANALIGLMRADPDVIMVGEVPDPETAKLVVQAAMTGHLVMATLHAQDAAEALRRLCELGVDPYLASSSVIGVMSQRLVRRLCPECKEPVEHDPALLARWREQAAAGGLAWPQEPPTFYRGQGCDACARSGYRGRVGIYELLTLDRELAAMLGRGADPQEIVQAAVGEGMTTMLADGFAKALAGVTTVEEVMRVLGAG